MSLYLTVMVVMVLVSFISFIGGAMFMYIHLRAPQPLTGPTQEEDIREHLSLALQEVFANDDDAGTTDSVPAS